MIRSLLLAALAVTACTTAPPEETAVSQAGLTPHVVPYTPGSITLPTGIRWHHHLVYTPGVTGYGHAWQIVDGSVRSIFKVTDAQRVTFESELRQKLLQLTANNVMSTGTSTIRGRIPPPTGGPNGQPDFGQAYVQAMLDNTLASYEAAVELEQGLGHPHQ